MRRVHEWFLHRGLPLVLTRRVRSRALIERYAPVVSGIGALTALTMLLADVTGGDPDYGYAVRLAVLAAVLTAAPFVLNLLHKIGSTASEVGRRSAALLVMAIFVVIMPVTASGWSPAVLAEVPAFLLVTVLAIWLTYVGFGSILLWALRYAWVQFGALGSLLSRALPLLMITLLVYFSGELWQLSARMTRQRLWQTIEFLSLVALVFIVTTIRDEVRALRDDRSEQAAAAKLLAGTPLASDRTSTPERTRLSLAEQLNVVAVMAVSQAIQVVFFTTAIFAFFLLLGIVAIPNDVTVAWSGETTCRTGEPPCAGTWFGISVPLPQTLVQTSLLVAVISGLYFTVNTSTDPQYRSRFFEPLIADVAVSLADRDAYLELEQPR